MAPEARKRRPFVGSSGKGAGVKDFPMFVRAIAFLLLLAPVAPAQQPTPIVPDPS